MNAATIEALFKTLVWDSLVSALTASLMGALSRVAVLSVFFTWGPVAAIISYLVEAITNKLFSLLKLAVDLEMITLQNALHHKAFQDAVVKLKVIAHDHGVDSDEFKKQREIEKQALSAFVHRSFGATPA